MDATSKKYYTISEVANMLGLSASLLRYCEHQFQQLRPKKSSHGIRKYTTADIEKIKKIRSLLKEKGYTIEGARRILSDKTSSDVSAQMIDGLKGMRNFLQRIHDGL